MELSLPFAALHLFEPGGAMGGFGIVGNLVIPIQDIPEVFEVGALVEEMLGALRKMNLRFLLKPPTHSHILSLVTGLVRGYALRYGLRSVTGRGIPTTGEIRRLTGLYAHVMKMLRGFLQVIPCLDAVNGGKPHAREVPQFLLGVVREKTDNGMYLLVCQLSSPHNSMLQ